MEGPKSLAQPGKRPGLNLKRAHIREVPRSKTPSIAPTAPAALAPGPPMACTGAFAITLSYLGPPSYTPSFQPPPPPLSPEGVVAKGVTAVDMPGGRVGSVGRVMSIGLTDTLIDICSLCGGWLVDGCWEVMMDGWMGE